MKVGCYRKLKSATVNTSWPWGKVCFTLHASAMWYRFGWGIELHCTDWQSLCSMILHDIEIYWPMIKTWWNFMKTVKITLFGWKCPLQTSSKHFHGSSQRVKTLISMRKSSYLHCTSTCDLGWESKHSCIRGLVRSFFYSKENADNPVGMAKKIKKSCQVDKKFCCFCIDEGR